MMSKRHLYYYCIIEQQHETAVFFFFFCFFLFLVWIAQLPGQGTAHRRARTLGRDTFIVCVSCLHIFPLRAVCASTGIIISKDRVFVKQMLRRIISCSGCELLGWRGAHRQLLIVFITDTFGFLETESLNTYVWGNTLGTYDCCCSIQNRIIK